MKTINLGIWFRVDTEEIGILTLENGRLWLDVGDFDYHFTILNGSPISFVGIL